MDRDREWQGEDSFLQSATIHFASGDIGRYEGLWNAPGPWSCTVATRQKRLEMRPLERLSVQLAGSRRADPVDPDPVDVDHKPGFYRQAEALLAAMAGKANAMPTLADGLTTMQLIHDIYEVSADPPNATGG